MHSQHVKLGDSSSSEGVQTTKALNEAQRQLKPAQNGQRATRSSTHMHNIRLARPTHGTNISSKSSLFGLQEHPP